jgi:hypothetical protein
MSLLEPNYLRYIYDGLNNGHINKENAAELPEGIIGLYENAFADCSSVIERQKLLQRYVIWALFKKAVSAAFVADILGETELQIQEFIYNNSVWFNSPASGRYQLYHERLKAYLLQKVSNSLIFSLHKRLLNRLETAADLQQGDELERYALEFMIEHIAVEAMISGDGKKLTHWGYSHKHWDRQLIMGNGYRWTKNGLDAVMSWASKYDEEEVLECGLLLLELHHQEQNAFVDIFKSIGVNDLTNATDRLKYFGDKSLLGKKRKIGLSILILYTLLNNSEENVIPYCTEILNQLTEIDSEGIDIYTIFDEEFLKEISSSLSHNSIDIPPILIDKKEIVKSNEIRDEIDSEVSQEGLIDQITDIITSAGIKTAQLTDFLSLSQERMIAVACDIIDELSHRVSSLKMNKFNSALTKFAILLLKNQVFDLESIKKRFKMGITTKSRHYNLFLEIWIQHAIHNKQWDIAYRIIDDCIDVQLKVKVICQVALNLDRNNLNDFLKQFLPQIQVDHTTIEIIFFTGSKFDCWPPEENPFFNCGLKLQMMSSPNSAHKQLLNVMNFINPIKDSESLIKLAIMFDNHIRNLSYNSNIREFTLFKMMVGTYDILLRRGMVDLVSRNLKQLHSSIGDLEDWLDLVSELFTSEDTPLNNREDLSRELAPFVDQLVSQEFNLNIGIGSKKRLVLHNLYLLKSIYKFNSKQYDWNLLMTELQIEPELQQNIGSELNHSQIDPKFHCMSLLKKIPIGNLQEVFDCTQELKLMSKFNLYFPPVNSRLFRS